MRKLWVKNDDGDNMGRALRPLLRSSKWPVSSITKGRFSPDWVAELSRLLALIEGRFKS